MHNEQPTNIFGPVENPLDSVEETDQMQRDLAAAANLIDVHTMFMLAPEDSIMEEKAGRALAEMVESISQHHPDKAADLIQSLLHVIFEARAGVPPREMFRKAGVKLTPMKNLKTDERV